MATKLSDSEISDAKEEFVKWEFADGSIHREFKFSGFGEAFGFMARLAIFASETNHHPEWSNVYSTVSITLSTHDVKGISGLDLDFARKADEMAVALGAG